MSVQVSPIQLVDGRTSKPVDAELRDQIEDQQLADWHTLWVPARDAILAELERRGVPEEDRPQSAHWQWENKIKPTRGLLAIRSFCVICSGETQGLMRVNLNASARLQSQLRHALVEVEYLEVAPWNQNVLKEGVRFSGVGMALMTAAVFLSQEQGFKGRIGLRALPQADNYYRKQGMSDLGPDPEDQRMRYFEMTPEQAAKFLK